MSVDGKDEPPFKAYVFSRASRGCERRRDETGESSRIVECYAADKLR